MGIYRCFLCEGYLVTHEKTVSVSVTEFLVFVHLLVFQMEQNI